MLPTQIGLEWLMRWLASQDDGLYLPKKTSTWLWLIECSRKLCAVGAFGRDETRGELLRKFGGRRSERLATLIGLGERSLSMLAELDSADVEVLVTVISWSLMSPQVIIRFAVRK